MKHQPFSDDGVVYCGWSNGREVIDGCGQVWPCESANATRLYHPAAPGVVTADLRSQLRALTPDGAQVVLSWLATEAGLHPEVAAALERALGCEAETRAK